MMRMRTLRMKSPFAILLLAVAFFLVVAPLALPAQAYAGTPDPSKTYLISNVRYRPELKSGSWQATVVSCNDASNITVPKEVKIEGVTMPVIALFPGAFQEKDSLKTLTIHAEVNDLTIALCSGCDKLQEVVVPTTVTKVYEYAFADCPNLASMSSLPNVESIGRFAFRNCSSLPAVITKNLLSVREGAFKNCTSLQSLAYGDDVSANAKLTTVSNSAFYGCKQLKYIGSLLNVRKIGDNAFWGCSSYPSFHFRDLTSVGYKAFQDCRGVQTINLGDVTTISEKAFENCEALVTVALGSKVERIGKDAFKGCRSLKTMNLPASLQSLGVGALMNCTSLTELTFPSPGNLKSVPSNLCKGCKSLTYVRIPKSINDTIGSDAFENSQLRQAFVLNKNVKFNGNPFRGCQNFMLIGYTGSSAEAYWKEHQSEFSWVALDGSAIGKATVNFDKGSSAASGTMAPASVATHGDYALPECGFAWAGHAFAGWKVDTRVFQPGDVIQDVMGTVTCTAVWDEASTVTLKGPSGDIVETYERGSSYVVPESPFTYDGKIFKCWYKQGDEGAEFMPGSTVDALPASLTLCAKFVTQAKVTLDPSGGTFAGGSTDSMILYTNKFGTLDDFPEVSKDGYEFGGWQLVYSPPGDPSHPQVIIVDPDKAESFVQYSAMQAGDRVVTLRALWVNNPPHDIVLDLNGGTIDGSEDPRILTTDNTGFLADNAVLEYQPVREHYVFDAWVFLSQDKIMPGFYHRYSSDTTLTASWRPVTVSKITLSPSTISLVQGKTKMILASVKPSDALDTSVKWSTSKASVATVSSAGKVTAVGPGTATITCASADGGAQATCTVKVTTGLSADGTALGAGADSGVAEEFLASYKKETDPAGSSFSALRFKASKVGTASITLAWKKVSGAKKYVLYGARCGNNKLMKVAALKASKSKYAWKKLAGKKLSSGKYYKAVMVAVGADGKVLATSKVMHAATAGGKVSNVKAVTTNAKKNAVALAKGKTFKLEGKAVPASAKLALKNHRKAEVLYESSNKKIATVTSKGVVKGKKAGTCYVYAYAQDGTFARIKVTVKSSLSPASYVGLSDGSASPLSAARSAI